MSQECLRARAQRETLVGNLKSTVTRPIGVGLSLGCGRLSLTDQERVCYNLHTVHGQMRWVVGSCNRIWGVGFLSISCPLTPGIRLYGVEVVEAGDSTDSRKRQEIKGLPLTRWKQAGDVVQLVRTLLSHRHNDVSDLKISNLIQPTSVRPVTVSAIFPHFRKLVVRFLEVPDVLLLRDRSASRMANSFSSRTDRRTFQ